MRFWQGPGSSLVFAAGVLALSLCGLVPAGVAAATTYFVDWSNGSDTADGLTPASAWKRAPGDSRAGPGPRAVRLGPGDRVQFRAGAAYRGTVVLRVSGDPDRPVRLVGAGWGPGRATMDGGEPAQARRCRSARDCLGEHGWASLWRLALPRQAPLHAPIFQAGMLLDRRTPGALQAPGTVRVEPGKRIAVAMPFEGRDMAFAVGMGRPGFLLVAGRHVEVEGFGFRNFADMPQRGPFAGAPVAGLQPVEGLRLVDLTSSEGPEAVPLRQAVAPTRSIAGYMRGPA